MGRIRPEPAKPGSTRQARVSIVRALSKLGICSRSEGKKHVAAGLVTVNGCKVFDPSLRIDPNHDRIILDGTVVEAEKKVYLVLNKPRGLVTTVKDEKGRATVFTCLVGAVLPRVTPVGRLDMASSGLLLFSNDTQWANRIMDPDTHIPRTYHVQVNIIPDEAMLVQFSAGIVCDGQLLAAASARIIRQGVKNAWIEIVLKEGKNRQIRRMFKSVGVDVLKLMRTAIGDLSLGSLASGKYRHLDPDEVYMLGRPGC